MEFKKLPVGIDGFEKIRENGFYYVDKTMFIAELLRNWGEVNLFTRPRRFGKSLNMSMLKAFFEVGCDKRLFDGLKITEEKELCKKYMGNYPVVSITLKDIDRLDFPSAVTALKSAIGTEAARFKFLLSSTALDDDEKNSYRALIKRENGLFVMPRELLTTSLQTLSVLLSKHYGHKTVILIDEYDVPLDKAFQNGYYDEMILLIRNLFGNALKGNSSMQFAVLTGCMRISKESIFTGLNNLDVMSITDEAYDEYFGFTAAEVQKLLTYYGLEDAADTVRQWYDGYRFGSNLVYCPWDVIKFSRALLTNRNALPENYWANTSGNDMVKRFIRLADQQTRDEIEQLIAGEPVVKTIKNELTYNELDNNIDNLWSVLFTTGYLTARERLSTKTFSLVIPNLELRELFINQVREWFKESMQTFDRSALFEAIWNGNVKSATEQISDILFHTISYHDYQESYYHAFLAGLFAGQGYGVESNYEHGMGRPDIVIKDSQNHRAMILEVKRVDTRSELPAACEKALVQIRDRRYAEDMDDYYRTVLCYGIAFFKKKCLLMKL